MKKFSGVVSGIRDKKWMIAAIAAGIAVAAGAISAIIYFSKKEEEIEEDCYCEE